MHNLLVSTAQLGESPKFPLPCPHCNSPLLYRAPKKSVSSLRCPYCKKTIRAGSAYTAASKLQAIQKTQDESLNSLLAKTDALKQQISKLTPFRIFSRRKARKRLAALEEKIACIRADQQSVRLQEYAYTAVGYYLDCWYRRTHIPTAHYKPSGIERGVIPMLSNDEVRVLAVSDKDLSAAGEYAVYRLAQRISKELDSPLFGSLVIPRAKFRWATNLNGELKLKEREVDCVIATQSCLFLIEVKTIVSHVLVSNSQHRIALSKQANIPRALLLGEEARKVTHRPFKKDQRILAQSKEEAEAAAKTSWPYPANRIFRVVVFVEPLSFTNSDCKFCDGLLVGCTMNGNQTFLSAIEQESLAHSVFITKDELAKLGGDPLCSFNIALEEAAEKAA